MINNKQRISRDQLIERQMAIFTTFCVGTPDINWIKNERWDKLQDWVCDNLRPEFSYATGISVMDAATNISESQVDNGMEELIEK